ncbi:T9SS type A sorting domain-containing protein [candidate division KSB1 bacterium]
MKKKSVLVFLLLLLPVSVYSQSKQIKPVLRKSSISTSITQNSINRIKPEPSYNILALRVEFPEDDNILTTGTGKFDYSENTGAIIDPPPHDRQYFLDHLKALKRYYYRVSGANLDITYDLYPEGDRTSYVMPNMIEYYSPNTTEDELDLRLGELIRDAVQLADSDPAVDFTGFNAVIIFHAGVGSEFALEEEALNPTPHDIPSVYMNLEDLQSTIGAGQTDFKGISVDGGTHYITSAVVVPETESKRDYEIGLNGIIAHQFGHHLGLPSLFNTSTGRPGIGKWGLMGVGFANFDGVIPAEPCAWSKVFLGWETPVEIEEGANNIVAASRSSIPEKIYKVAISPTEYYLIENRQTDFDGDSLKITFGQSGIVLEVDDYDLDIPGSGLLIWHIDEKVIAAGLQDNTVNADKSLKGVDLEEADGSQDIGEVFPGLIPGTLSPENGLPWDAFYEGNNTTFTQTSNPNTDSNYRGKSHINITDISANGNTMTFSVSRDMYIDGFPKFLGGDFSGKAPIWTDPDNPEKVKILAANKEGKVFALNGSNQSLLQNGYSADYISLLDDTVSIPAPLFADAGEEIVFQPAVRDNSALPTILDNRLFTVTEKPSVRVYSLEDNNSDNFGDLLNSWDLSSAVTAQPMITQWLVTGMNNGNIVYYDHNGSIDYMTGAGAQSITGFAGAEIYSGTSLQAVTLSIDAAGNSQQFVNQSSTQKSYSITNAYDPVFSSFSGMDGFKFILVNSEGKILVDDLSGSLPEQIDLNTEIEYPPVLGDIDGDGVRNIVLISGNKILALNPNGTIVTGFPLNLYQKGFSGTISTEPVLGDIDGDGIQDIVFGTTNGNIIAVGGGGNILNGFPLAAGSEITGSLTILRSAGSDNIELAAFDEQGFLYMWDLETTYDDKVISWGTLGRDNAHLRNNDEVLAKVSDPVKTDEQQQIMPQSKVYNWPNPNLENWTKIRYYLTETAQVKIRIFTQVGDLVAELSGPGLPDTDNEVTWDLTAVDSGVYLAEVVAEGNGKTSRKVIKIAVIK